MLTTWQILTCWHKRNLTEERTKGKLLMNYSNIYTCYRTPQDSCQKAWRRVYQMSHKFEVVQKGRMKIAHESKAYLIACSTQFLKWNGFSWDSLFTCYWFNTIHSYLQCRTFSHRQSIKTRVRLGVHRDINIIHRFLKSFLIQQKIIQALSKNCFGRKELVAGLEYC